MLLKSPKFPLISTLAALVQLFCCRRCSLSVYKSSFAGPGIFILVASLHITGDLELVPVSLKYPSMNDQIGANHSARNQQGGESHLPHLWV